MEKSKFLTSLVVVIVVLPYANATFSGTKVKEHSVLVHTGCHGAWSWYKIVELMTSSGNNVTAIDLGASRINPKIEIPHFSDCLSLLMEFMASPPTNKKVVLVGHSLGGLPISKAMEIFPQKISVAVFVTALMPGPTLNAATLHTQLDLALATTLIRPYYLYHVEDISKDIVLSRTRYESVRRVFIEKNPPDEVEVIQDSDHMTMMSKPLQLFTTLLNIANKYN